MSKAHPINNGTEENPVVGEYYGPVFYCENCSFGKDPYKDDSFILPSFKLCPNCGAELIW